MGTACVAACLLLLGACDGEGGTDDAIPADCGLPSPDPAARAGLIPAPFLLDGEALVATASRRKGGVTGVLNIRLSVADAFPIYKKAIRRAGFELVGEDNEGFEAELYMKRGKELGALQIRTSLCEDAAVVFVNIVAGNFAMPIVTTPSPASP
ncbi:MAG: hypothetical protein M3273_10220 [Actinomycetota bacterium]|nr:hypothetical protein [Actinomycetota bacterium]